MSVPGVRRFPALREIETAADLLRNGIGISRYRGLYALHLLSQIFLCTAAIGGARVKA
jgi:hypothetical protein